MKKIKIMTILFTIVFLGNCSNQQHKQIEVKTKENQQLKQVDERPNETASCLISEKCLALLAYGLLSDDEYDIPFGGTCKDVAPDSLIVFLRTLKREFKDSKLNNRIDAKELIKQIEKNEAAPCQLSDCITLIAYGLLSADMIDIPTDGACIGIVSDSLVHLLQVQKRIFKRWQYDSVFNKDSIDFDWTDRRDINLLRWLILSRIMINDPKASSYLMYTKDAFGTDNLFFGKIELLHRLRSVLGLYKSFKLDTLLRNTSFSNVALYIDTSASIGRILNWCGFSKECVQRLNMFTGGDSSKKDFLMKYYDYRCQDEEYYTFDIDMEIEKLQNEHSVIYYYIPDTLNYMLLDNSELDMLVTQIKSINKNSRYNCYSVSETSIKRCVLKTDSVYIDYIDNGKGGWQPLYFRIQTENVPMLDGKLKIGMSWKEFLNLIRLNEEDPDGEKRRVEYLESKHIKVYLGTKELYPPPYSYAYFYFTKGILREVIWVSVILRLP